MFVFSPELAGCIGVDGMIVKCIPLQHSFYILTYISIFDNLSLRFAEVVNLLLAFLKIAVMNILAVINMDYCSV